MLYAPNRIGKLGEVQAVLCGGGWTNRSREAYRFFQYASRMRSEPIRLLSLPTPTSEPCRELDLLRSRLRNHPGVEFSPIGTGQVWPSPPDVLAGLAWANMLIVPGGNFTDYMAKVAQADISHALKEAILSGRVRLLGSSNGTVSNFDTVHTADIPNRYGGGTAKVYWNAAGLGIIPGHVCAHYNERNEHTGIPRAQLFQSMLSEQPAGTIGFGIDTQAAFVLNRGKFRVITRDRYAHIQRIIVEKGKRLRISRLLATDPPTPIGTLFA